MAMWRHGKEAVAWGHDHNCASPQAHEHTWSTPRATTQAMWRHGVSTPLGEQWRRHPMPWGQIWTRVSRRHIRCAIFCITARQLPILLILAPTVPFRPKTPKILTLTKQRLSQNKKQKTEYYANLQTHKYGPKEGKYCARTTHAFLLSFGTILQACDTVL